MDIQKELKKWAEETVKVYNPKAESTGTARRRTGHT